MREKELFERALGVDEPPLRVDFEDIERRGMRAIRRRRAVVPGIAAAAAAVALSGVVFVLTDSKGGDHGTVQVAVDSTTSPTGSTSSRNSQDQRTAVPTTRSAAYCYKTADIRSAEPDQHVLVGVSGDAPDGRGDAASRVMNICEQAWRKNYYGWHPSAEGSDFPVPQLVACVLNNSAVDAQEGAVAVFPGTPQTCADLGLPIASL